MIKKYSRDNGGEKVLKLEDEQLLVEIAIQGAELQKIYNKKENFDYLWNGNPDFWGSHAPNLFPIIGRLNDYKYKKDGQKYELPQHGFAKDFEFEVEESSDKKAVFVLKSNEETKAMYPYHFSLAIIYSLEGSELKVAYKVENNSTETMPFSIGGHPAFNIPMNGEGTYDDYTLTINPKKEVNYFESDPVPYRSGNKKTFKDMENGVLKMNHETFRDGLIIIDEPTLETVTLASPDNKYGVTLDVSDFPYLCLWTKEQMDAPFICIEPFYGLPDVVGEIGTLEEKEGIILLEANEQKEVAFTIATF